LEDIQDDQQAEYLKIDKQIQEQLVIHIIDQSKKTSLIQILFNNFLQIIQK